MQDAIRNGFAASKTEVLRQALMLYKNETDVEWTPKKMGAEEKRLVGRAMAEMSRKIASGEMKTYPLDDVLQELGLDREGNPVRRSKG